MSRVSRYSVSVSTDGTTWTSHDVPEFEASHFGVNSIAYGNGVFVGVGRSVPSRVYTSTDSWCPSSRGRGR